MARYLYSELAHLVTARANCEKSGNTEWFERHEDLAESLVKNLMPSGSGFDNGTKLDFDRSHAERLVFTTAFHHMHESGMYDGWTEHVVTVTPSFSGFNLRISGRNRNDIKDYMGDAFHHALSEDCTFAVFQSHWDVSVSPEWRDGRIACWTANIATIDGRERGAAYCSLGDAGTRAPGNQHDEFTTREAAENAAMAFVQANQGLVVRI